ncbi:hypothetical protein RN001_014234 [Aquatica leii]|uniref:EGF-like domain-containing protein n=1 Tax=Aquatica leii TaxID=1421715 RepID=A0AAN7SEF6_9COLE|nr:hypothetical protein RN001_014234 [Aquatica leii]
MLARDVIDSSPRRRRQDENDVTTVLLVNNQGPSTFGRFLSVKPDLGLITSTARTFIQEGVTTQYATQVLGTTLDNGRLYAHLLTKSSRVLYDNDKNTRTPNDVINKKWNLDENLINSQNFIKNIDFITPNKPDTYLVFPTVKPNAPDVYKFVEKEKQEQETTDDEILKSSPSDNARVPFDSWPNKNGQSNIKVFQITAKQNDINQENAINHKELNDPAINAKHLNFEISKVRERDSLATFTVRNEFSPSGLTYLGDFPYFDSNTERSKSTTAAERKAKLLFLSGKNAPDLRKLPTVTYTGFADFTTVVGDTVIVFTPHTSSAPKYDGGKATSISVEATLQEATVSDTAKQPRPTFRTSSLTTIRPTTSKTPLIIKPTVRPPQLPLKPSFTIRRPKPTKEYVPEIEPMHSVVIDASDRHKEPSDEYEEDDEQHEDMDAKSAVLAHEQKMSVFKQSPTPQIEQPLNALDSTVSLAPSAIEPSESTIPMLSTPSEEDIAKILASLQAAQNQQATEPLEITSSTLDIADSTANFEDSSTTTIGGATTIFFDDDFFLQNTNIFETTKKSEEPQISTTTDSVTVTEEPEEETLPTTKQETTTTKLTETTIKLKETTTTEKDEITTQSIETTTQGSNKTESDKHKVVPISDVTCTEGVQIIPTTVYKTLTYLTTFFIPQDETSTSISVKSNEVVSTEIGFETHPCTESIVPSVTSKQTHTVTTTTEQQTTNEITTPELDSTTERLTTTPTSPIETTPLEITTERRHVTESDPETTEMTTENGDEIEVLFKTLYTTYTYLTTFFQGSTSSVVSRKEVITNVITSTLEPGSEITDPAIAGLFNNDYSSAYKSRPPSFDDIPNISPTSVGVGRPTVSYPITEEDIRENILDQDLVKPTPALNDKSIQAASGIKTYYTTYTYFTTIFVDGETEISSRTEVYTNYVTPVQHNIEPTIFSGFLTTTEKDQIELPKDEEDVVPEKPIPSKNYDLNYSTLNRGSSDNNAQTLNITGFETISTMVTDVRSSTSTGESRIIDNIDNRNVLEDQMVAESNNDSDILPSPTLLLQTSYTTFTYFTTIYQGTTASSVVSSLDTITNVVTETLTPTHSLSAEDLNLPITYFTTFTYWTTLYKDGVTRVTSREETISNVVAPTSITTTTPASINVTPFKIIGSTTADQVSIEPTKSLDKDELTTYYTTYTYYTTSYVGDSTVINSRLDTVTNIVNDTNQVDANQIARAIGTANQNQIDSNDIKPTASMLPTGLLSTVVSTIENSGTTTLLSTDIYGTYIDGLYAKVLESTTSIIIPSSVQSSKPVLPTGVVSINQGKIIDAEGISTLYFTTQAIGTYIDNLYAQVIESTSSLNVDEEKKSIMNTDELVKHKTGLVRLIEGSIVQNRTTTLYQSKVIGTVIDGRYAQIIESTSSFIIEKTQAPAIAPTASNISPSATQAPSDQITPTSLLITPSPVVIESSLSDSTKTEEENATESGEGDEEDEEEEDEDQDNAQPGESGRKKSRLTFQSRKRTFTPVIRPFASRGRPTFAPKRTKLGPSSATTITRSDFTPTVTAVPASKTSGRFGARKTSSSNGIIQPTASGTRRFVRPKSSSTTTTGFSSSFVPRGKSSSRITPTASGTRKFVAKTSSQLRSSSLYTSSNRFARVRPTAVSSTPRPSSRATTPFIEINDADNDLTTQLTESPTEFTDETQETTLNVATTTEVTRRAQNPLLKLRKPLARPTPSPKTPLAKPVKFTSGKTISNKATTTTAKPKTTRPIAALQSRERPGNGLFPRRGLFTTTTTAAPEEEDDEEEDDLDGEELEPDTDYEGSNRNTRTERAPTTQSPRNGRANAQVSPRPYRFRQRSKRDTTFTRFRRPPSFRSTVAPKEEVAETEEIPLTKPPRFKSRSRINTVSSTSPKYESNKRITPTRASPSQGRSQFTLREKDKPTVNTARNGYRRGSTQSQPTRRTTTISSRPKVPKLRTQHTTEHSRRKVPETSRSSVRTGRRGTTTYRSRNSAEINDNYVLSKFNDGTITVTHSIPTEITIPVVNGRVTEYRNVITAKYSTEVLIPQQYSTAVNSLGQIFTVLKSDSTNVAGNGATEITRYVLNETPTTTIIFTPTYIRGHKTSWSHILPSTVYQVEQVVSTIKPALSAQAPLANILLSQLLLGNPGLQPNPLLGLQNPLPPATPTTEFKTRTTTYVTTVTSETSTVIPITFRGKQILTTIIDNSVSVVTATEFITDTIVVTPTLAGNGNLNSLLLPLLLQQQQQQPGQLQQPAGVFGISQDQVFPDIDNKYDFLSFDDNKSVSESEEYTEQTLTEDVTRPPRRKSSRKKQKAEKNITPATPPKESSIVTLYVSGKTPGEFSTVLSTVISNEEAQRRKREVVVQPSNVVQSQEPTYYSYIDTFVSPALAEQSSEDSSEETQSLESVLGDVSKYVVTNTPELFDIKPTNLRDLDELTPLMPKVETSILTKRGALELTPINDKTVSNIFGKRIRHKRDVNNSLPNRRVVKKLIRVRPIDKENLDVSDTVMNSTNRPYRKRVLVRKRLRIQPTPTTHSRRTVVVTKKRLLNPTPIDLTSSVKESSSLPPYEPFFPELSESLSELVFLKTTVVSSVEFDTSTVVQSRLRTYTYVVTRVNGDEHVVTSTTEIKPQTKTLTVTVPRTIFTTLTLLDWEETQTLPIVSMTVDSISSDTTTYFPEEEPRYNLATRVMSNGVEVIVAGDKTTLPGEPDVKRVLPTTIYKPVTLKPSTLSDHMMMFLPQESNVEILPTSLYLNQFVTKTCLTTFTYLTTYLENGTTTVSSHEQVVSNIATEERNPQRIMATSSTGITLTQHPNLAAGTFLTTYTYLNTIIDGEQPIVVTSKRIVTNTVTAPDDYLSLLQPSYDASAIKDTNTYYSTAFLQKTLYEGKKTQVVSTNEVVTQVVITESIPPKATSVMTSYIALDIEPSSLSKYSTTNVVKTYYVTYTYHSPAVENGKTTTKVSVSTSTDVVTEKIFLQPKRTSVNTIVNTAPIAKENKSKIALEIYATKTYATTYTSFVTLLENKDSTVISSNTKVVENVVTETFQQNQFDSSLIGSLQNDLKKGTSTITKYATLKDGAQIQITAIKKINPTKVLPIEKTIMAEIPISSTIESSNPNVITGSTIIFFDDDDTHIGATPMLGSDLKTKVKNNLNSLLSNEIVKKTITKTQTKRHASTTTRPVVKNKVKTVTNEPPKKKTNVKIGKPTEIPDLLGLGSVNTFQVLKPVINAMAGLIKTNIKNNQKNFTTPVHQVGTSTNRPPATDTQNRSPIYIPIGDQIEGLEIAESQNLATIHINEWEKSPLLNGGIPISPGQIITTNSDVIVGRPGRIGPRIPAIPVNEYQSEIPTDINPPPNWSKVQNNVVSESKKGEYLGPPPTPKPKIPLRPHNFVRGEKHKILDNKRNRFPPPNGFPNIQFETPIMAKPIREFNLEESILNQAMVLPEVIDRSTGQPILVNLQPSQVAFVNIPRNQSTAFIYGGTTELHKNGQYFDDPAPYPIPEFSILQQVTSSIQNIPLFTSVYEPPNQKQVGGFIKVATDVINNNPEVLPIISSQILPSKPMNVGPDVIQPISYEMVHQGNDFNAHIINHGNVLVRPYDHHYEAGTYNISNRPYYQSPGPNQILNDVDQNHHQKIITDLPSTQMGNVVPPQNDLKEYLTPPKPPQKLQVPHKFKRPPIGNHHYYYNRRPHIPINTHRPIKLPNFISPTESELEDYHKYDDLANEDGEVIQESNARPLLPGEIPIEILENYHKKSTTTTPPPNTHNVNFGIQVAGHENEVSYQKPVVQYPRPFEISPNKYQPVVRPENQQNNQIDIKYFDTVTQKTTTSTTTTTRTTTTTASTTTPLFKNRPKVTSMPINTPIPSQQPIVVGTQTEQPFKKLNLTIKRNYTKPLLALLDMEIMKPPPVPKPQNKIETEFPSRKPIDLEVQESSQSHKLPPKTNYSDTVVGLVPPPASYPITTHRPKINITTYKPVFSLEINPPRPIHPYTFDIPSSTTTPRPVPFTRRPTRITTRTTTTTTAKSTTPVSTISAAITNSTSNYTVPMMEVIIGVPKVTTSVSIKPIKVENASTSTSATSPSPVYDFTKVHHAGNEIKIVEDTDTYFATSSSTPPLTVLPTITPTIVTSVKDSKYLVPTRYITHTKTATVTITKTTVIKTLGGPPSTMTVLVTKTEKSTRVDTVTEIHTLVQPTSVVETITTTVSQLPTSIYPTTVTYESITPTPTIESTITAPEDDLEEFIIHDTDPPPTKSQQNTTVHIPSDNDSIFVVMTDKKHKEVVSIPEKETDVREEVADNEVNHILLGGILIDSPPSLDPQELGHPDRCNPECKASKNELCQKVHGLMRCVCRPGFARMFPDRPCKPTYTYKVRVILERNGKEKLRYNKSLANTNSTDFNRLAGITHESLDRMVMQSDLRDIYHGVQVHNYEPTLTDEGLFNIFYLQLSDNTEKQRLEDIFKKYLKSNNYSLGGTDLYASRKYVENLVADDFDECTNTKYHDCSEHAHCFNMPGTYTCSCKEGFSDLSENSIYPGRACSAELIGCERCHYHGTCYSRGDEQLFCECFHWYTGEYCHINLKVLLIALVTLGALLLILLFACILLTCCRKRPSRAPHTTNISFMPQRLAIPSGKRGTLDRRAMIHDSSSEGSQSDINTLPYVAKKPKRESKGVLKKTPAANPIAFVEQKDRSLPVMIPRAKYHPTPPNCVSMVPTDKRKTSAASSNETKLLSYLDVGPNPNNSDQTRKHSNAHSDSFLQCGKISGGALVSAGFEVSATVGSGLGTIGTIATTCGTEADRSENATLIQKISADLLSSTGTRSQFTTFRKSLADDGEDHLSNWLDITPKVTATVSETRSYDETTIQAPTKSYRNGFDSKPSSQHPNDEANTMAERDVGSTFLLPHTQLYKRDRGSDISGFDSL